MGRKPRDVGPLFQGGRVIAVLCFATSIGAAQTATPPPTAAAANGTMRGRVVAADSGTPVRKVEVQLTRVDAAPGGALDAIRRPRGARTDVDGKYEFTDLPPGRYQLSVAKAPYVGQSWGQTQPTSPVKLLDLHAGETLDRLDFSLVRGGVITGRVVDEFGEPLSGVDMRVVMARPVGGHRDLQEMNFASTNDLGEFRMFGIAPGQYYVKAAWRRAGAPIDPDSPDRTGYPETFFPGTSNVEEAQRFTVRGGETIADLAMALSPIKTVRIQGTVVNVNGRPSGPMNILVMKGDGRDGMTFGSPVRPDGSFVVGNLTAGEYTLRAQVMPPQKDSAIAVLKVTVGVEDLEDVRMVAVSPSTIAGRVIVDPAQSQSLPAPLMLSLMAVNGQFFTGMETTRVGDDQSFTMTAAAGRYRINWMNASAGWTIRTIRINNTDVTDDDIEVKAGENISGVDIELTNKSATIAGTVTARSGAPSAGGRVFVFAADKKLWTPNARYFRMGSPGQDGRFKITGLPSGSYNIVALESVDVSTPFNDPEFLQRISASAEAVTLTEGESRTIDLRITSP